MEIAIDGKTFFVSANFDWERDAVDYRFDPSRGYSGQGQDLLAEVAFAVLEIEIWGADVSDTISLSLVKQISEKTLDLFRNSEDGTRPLGWGAWM